MHAPQRNMSAGAPAAQAEADMVEIPLETQTPAGGRLGMLTAALPSMLNGVPKLLPMMLCSLFCLQLGARARAAEPSADLDIESAATDPALQAVVPRFAVNPHVFLVPRLPEGKVYVVPPRPVRAAQRLMNWFKHSVLRVPRAARVLG